jgi:hypothetical protein
MMLTAFPLNLGVHVFLEILTSKPGTQVFISISLEKLQQNEILI